MKKRFLSVFLALATIIMTFPFCTVFADLEDHEVPFWMLDENDPTQEHTSGDFVYTISDDGAVIADYLGNADKLTVPSTLNGINVIAIGEKAFYESSLGTESPSSITLPSTVKSIGRYAFAWCTDLSEINLPASLTEIGEAAFAGTALTNVTIPSGVASIGKRAFADCGALTSISVSSENTAFASVDGILYSKDMTSVVCVPSGIDKTSVEIPAGVTSVGASAFYGCASLTSVSLPAGVTSIGDEAFGFCTGLESLDLPDTVTEIGDWAFAHCTNMASITLPDRVTSIGEEAFLLCESLTSAVLPNALTEISYSAFAGCYALSNVSLPEGIISVGDLAFYNCKNLTSVVIPKSTVTFGDAIFDECTALETVYLYEGSAADTFVTTELPDADIVYINSFLTFTGFQVRETKYNGLRTLFTVDNNMISSLEDNGLTVIEYGTLMASTAKLESNGDMLTVANNNGEYEPKSYARKIPVFIDGELTGVLAESTSEIIKYACTITKYNQTNYAMEATIRGYAVLRDCGGNEFVIYIDYPNPNYRSLSLKGLATVMANAHAIDKTTNISYLDVLSFDEQN